MTKQVLALIALVVAGTLGQLYAFRDRVRVAREVITERPVVVTHEEHLVEEPMIVHEDGNVYYDMVPAPEDAEYVTEVYVPAERRVGVVEGAADVAAGTLEGAANVVRGIFQ